MLYKKIIKEHAYLLIVETKNAWKKIVDTDKKKPFYKSLVIKPLTQH